MPASDPQKNIRVLRGLARVQMGSCNACQRRDDPFVTVIELRTTSFRLCSRCERKLSNLLALEKVRDADARK